MVDISYLLPQSATTADHHHSQEGAYSSPSPEQATDPIAEKQRLEQMDSNGDGFINYDELKNSNFDAEEKDIIAICCSYARGEQKGVSIDDLLSN